MAKVKGVVDRISSKKIGKGAAYSFKVNDEWYRHGFDKPKFKEGYLVQFDDEPINQYDVIDIDTVKFKKGEPVKSNRSAKDTAKGAKSGGSENWEARAKYWDDKDKRDIVKDGQYNYRSAFHMATELVNTGISTLVAKGDEMVPMLALATPKAAPAKKWEAYLTLIEQLAADLHAKFLAAGGDGPTATDADDDVEPEDDKPKKRKPKPKKEEEDDDDDGDWDSDNDSDDDDDDDDWDD